MTVDLEDFVGKRVKVTLRDGSLHYSVVRVSDGLKEFPYELCFIGGSVLTYTKNGRFFIGEERNEDIIKIEEGEFKEIKEEETKEVTSSTQVSNLEGIKGKGDLSNKAHIRAISPDLLIEVGKVFRYGQKKHGVDNFRKMTVEAAGEVFDSLMRHTLEFQSGIVTDKESGRNNVAMLVSNASMLYRLGERYGWEEVIKVISGGDLKEVK